MRSEEGWNRLARYLHMDREQITAMCEWYPSLQHFWATVRDWGEHAENAVQDINSDAGIQGTEKPLRRDAGGYFVRAADAPRMGMAALPAQPDIPSDPEDGDVLWVGLARAPMPDRPSLPIEGITRREVRAQQQCGDHSGGATTQAAATLRQNRKGLHNV